MKVRLAALLIVLTILGCAALASFQHQEQELRIDAHHATVPMMPGAMVCRPVLYPRHPDPQTEVRA